MAVEATGPVWTANRDASDVAARAVVLTIVMGNVGR